MRLNRFAHVMALAAAAVLPAAAVAQDASGEQPVNRIVAIVGNRPILLSDVEEMINAQRSRGFRPPTDSAGYQALVRQVTEQLVDEELLYQQAVADTSIVVEDADVRAQVDQTVQRAQAQLGSEAKLREALKAEGLGTLEEWRRQLTEQAKRAQYQQQLLSRLRQEDRLPPVPVSDADLREAFERNKDARPRKPAQVSFRQIIVQPKPSAAAKAAARAKAESLLVEIRAGGDFAQIAKRESMDGSRELGGDLGWNRRGKMVPEFERWMFAL
ncbi:MAG TPA: peptidylprolyl isomerase, partial [Gemmatimonadaceae bacterium]|nr:peptidylprolyl isomerase [Gemmatimonadaceae bacterium]